MNAMMIRSWRASMLAITLALTSASAHAQSQGVWSLSVDQRKDYLVYYSPILLLRADEPNTDSLGKSWVTNFDFDRDMEFRNNSSNWNKIGEYVKNSPSTEGWEIRPTVYSALIEFMDNQNQSKSVVLIYHIYHARDARGIHDWERIEIRVDNVSGTPGASNEFVRFATITEHLYHRTRHEGSEDLNFHETPSGKHVMIWQAQWSNALTAGANNQELRFVQDSFSDISQRIDEHRNADVNTNGGSSRKNVHYVFVCGGAVGAVGYWDARSISRRTADTLAIGEPWGNTVKWDRVKRVKYELQDIADIFPTHWEHHEDIAYNWKGSPIAIDLATPIVDESGNVEVPAGMQKFLPEDRFQQPDTIITKDRAGYPNKVWIWGAYTTSGKNSAEVRDHMFERVEYPSRAAASNKYDSLGQYWWQHDYFAHDGGDGVSGRWLPGDWYKESAGGWDGRWVQIFDDDGSDTSRVVISCQASPSSMPAPDAAILLASLILSLSVLRYGWRRFGTSR